MDFGLSEEQQLLQETVRGFVENECPTTRLRELFDGGIGHDPGLWRGLSEMGLAGLAVPESHGGAGLEVLDVALVAEVLGYGALPGPFLGHSLSCLAIAAGDSEEARSRWLAKLGEGSTVGSVALGEGSGGWEPGDWSVQCRDGRLHGEKVHVPHAADCDLLVVGTEGAELVVVEREAEGVRVESLDGIDRTRPVYRVCFDDAPAEPLAGGLALAERVRDAGLVLLAADAFGAATRLIELSVAYAKSREQFGYPIAQFQAVKHQLARMGTDIEPTRGLFWYAAYACDHLPDEAAEEAAIAKAHVSDRAIEVARQAVEVHGGYGFTWECEVHMWMKRIMFDRAFLGTPDALRARAADLAGW